MKSENEKLQDIIDVTLKSFEPTSFLYTLISLTDQFSYQFLL